MKTLLKTYSILLCLFLASNVLAQESTEIVIVANEGLDISTITKKKVAKLYYGETQMIGKLKAKPCYRGYDSPAGKIFFDEIIKTSPTYFSKYWVKRIFSGYGTSPEKFDEEFKMLYYISKEEGSLGFMDKKTVGIYPVIVR
ncbi:MAG: hypothetical protein HRT72_09410 [Flavobacteriales bacterium]|nr:hypothetical protein [Flavobacteriales bacterium]